MRKSPARALTIPPRSGQAPPPPADLYQEPTEDLLILGEMLHDVKTMAQLLAALPFDRESYRANLRIVAGCAVRTRARCSRLLGDPPPDPEAVIERLATAIVREVDRADPPEPSNKIDDVLPKSTLVDLAEADDAEQLRKTADALASSPNLVHEDPVIEHGKSPNSQLTRKNPADRPKKTGNGYTVVESFVMSELKDRGTATTTELLTAITALRRVPSKEVEAAIANLRITKRITTTRLGRGFLNRIAEGVGA